jgi:hypothetical protein
MSFYYSVPTRTVHPEDDPESSILQPDIESTDWQAQYFDDGTCLVRSAEQLQGIPELTLAQARQVCIDHDADPDVVMSWMGG